MPLRTQPVQLLVQDAIQNVTQPYSEDIIEDVALVIEQDRQLRPRYDLLCTELRQWVVNNWIGQYVKLLTGRNSLRQVTATRATIIGSYTKLEV